MDKKQTLERLDLFKRLTKEELDSIAQLCETRKYSVNEIIFEEKSRGKDIFFVTKGRARIELGIKGKKDSVTIHRVREGDVFGELALVSEAPRSATAQCETNCETVSISRDALLDLFNRNARIGYVVAMNLAYLLATRLRKTNLQLVACFLWE